MHRLLQLPEDLQVLVWRFVYTGALNQLLDKFKAADMEYDMECYYVSFRRVNFHSSHFVAKNLISKFADSAGRGYGDYNEIDYEYYDNLYESLYLWYL